MSKTRNSEKHIIPIEIGGFSSGNGLIQFYSGTECRWIHDGECSHVKGVISFRIDLSVVFDDLISRFCEKKKFKKNDVKFVTHNGHREIEDFYYKCTMEELIIALPWLD